MKWIADYKSFLDWYIVPATVENIELYGDGNKYDSFAKAKNALIKEVKQKIEDDRYALKSIKSRSKSDD